MFKKTSSSSQARGQLKINKYNGLNKIYSIQLMNHLCSDGAFYNYLSDLPPMVQNYLTCDEYLMAKKIRTNRKIDES